MNKVILSGNVISDFKREEYNDKNKIRNSCIFTLEVRDYNVKNNEMLVSLIEIRALDTKASILSNTIEKGDKISVSAKIKIDINLKVNIILDDFTVIESNREKENQVS